LINDKKPNFPFLCLTVSGGHTQIVKCKAPLEMEILGETIDDAAGEAFDKAAKMLGLPYPGGPLIDKYAKLGNPKAYTFAKPNIPNFNFSFSGVKTSILYFLQKEKVSNPAFIEENLNDLCASIQHTIISILMKKLNEAAKQTGIRDICIAGGVSANSGLRNAIEAYGKKYRWNYYIPDFQYCTDNAGMIAITGYYKFLAGEFADNFETASARSHF
jgi:N6-L-threonylcarbamoyladenine synthase